MKRVEPLIQTVVDKLAITYKAMKKGGYLRLSAPYKTLMLRAKAVDILWTNGYEIWDE
jgi:hypothetical protein